MFMAALFAGCATAPDKVDIAEPDVPERAEGEVAVFGKVRVVEDIQGVFEVKDQDSAMYVKDEATGINYKLKCAGDGSFGVYLPPGAYRVKLVNADDYRFVPFASFTVPEGSDALYIGTLELDGSPSGVYKGEYDWFADTNFIYSIKDESAGFLAGVRKVSPGAESRVAVMLMEPEGSVAIGSYDDKVLRSQDVIDGMAARKDAVEHIVGGALMSLSYVINPIWMLTLH
jgi:hypothetical protein